MTVSAVGFCCTYTSLTYSPPVRGCISNLDRQPLLSHLTHKDKNRFFTVDNCSLSCYIRAARATIVNQSWEAIIMSENLACKITGSELEVMKLLWRAEDALPVTEIREKLQKSKGWEPATIKTLISRLVSKGVVRQEKRNVYFYSPIITEKEYSKWATEDLVTRLYNGKVRDLVAALVSSDGLTQEDLDELRQMFKVEE